MISIISLLVVCFAVELSQCSIDGVESVDCPPWTILDTTTNHCMCGSDLYGIVQCSSETHNISVQECYCMTYSEALKKTLLSYCFYTCHPTHFVHHYPIAARNVSDLNDVMCNSFNRTGLLCGECIAGYAPPVYSYSISCVECRNYKYNWLKYIAVAYLPLTLFYVAIILLRISVNSAPMIVYVTISQIISSPGLVRWFVGHSNPNPLSTAYLIPHAIWNLDFFRGLYQPFCLHPDLSLLQVTCLDYIIGIYPLGLIFITYCLVRLHDRYVVISKLWRPVYTACSMLRKEWNIRESLVSGFATFLILSYIKIMNVSVDILTFNRAAYDVNGDNSNLFYLLINGSLPYFSHEHVPYAISAMFMITTFNFVPLILLCIYPCSCFQKCLNLVGCRSHLLHIFMDTFSGCFREKPRDCRYFAGFYVFLRVANLVILSVFTNPLYFWGMTLMFILAVILLVVCKPYKNSKRNVSDAILFSIAMIFFITLNAFIESYYALPISARQIYSKFRAPLGLLFIILPLYGIGLIIYQVGKLFFKLTGFHCLSIQRREEEPLLDSISENRNL